MGRCDMDVSIKWYEELPEQCPPAEAFIPRGFVCYRLCEGEAPSDVDFLSHRHLTPHKKFSVPECQARAISVFQNSEDLSGVLKLAAHRHKKIVRITLDSCDGAAMKTSGSSHYSWWRSAGFVVARAIEDVA